MESTLGKGTKFYFNVFITKCKVRRTTLSYDYLDEDEMHFASSAKEARKSSSLENPFHDLQTNIIYSKKRFGFETYGSSTSVPTETGRAFCPGTPDSFSRMLIKKSSSPSALQKSKNPMPRKPLYKETLFRPGYSDQNNFANKSPIEISEFQKESPQENGLIRNVLKSCQKFANQERNLNILKGNLEKMTNQLVESQFKKITPPKQIPSCFKKLLEEDKGEDTSESSLCLNQNTSPQDVFSQEIILNSNSVPAIPNSPLNPTNQYSFSLADVEGDFPSERLTERERGAGLHLGTVNHTPLFHCNKNNLKQILFQKKREEKDDVSEIYEEEKVLLDAENGKNRRVRESFNAMKILKTNSDPESKGRLKYRRQGESEKAEKIVKRQETTKSTERSGRKKRLRTRSNIEENLNYEDIASGRRPKTPDYLQSPVRMDKLYSNTIVNTDSPVCIKSIFRSSAQKPKTKLIFAPSMNADKNQSFLNQQISTEILHPLPFNPPNSDEFSHVNHICKCPIILVNILHTFIITNLITLSFVSLFLSFVM